MTRPGETTERFTGIEKWLSEKRERFAASAYVRKTKQALKSMIKGTRNEVDETRDMANTFFKLLSQQLDLESRSEPPSKEEVHLAIEQLKDVARISVFASISILPGGGFSLIGLELLARKYGIKNFTFVPSSFRQKKEKTTQITPLKPKNKTE